MVLTYVPTGSSLLYDQVVTKIDKYRNYILLKNITLSKCLL